MSRVVVITVPSPSPWLDVPVQAARLAAALEQARGDDPRILDRSLFSVNDLVTMAVGCQPDVVVLWMDRKADAAFFELCQPLRQALSHIPLLVVGPGVQAESMVFRTKGLIDGAVIGFYNEAVLETVRRGQVPLDCPGVAMAGESGAVLANKPAVEDDPDEWGLPAYHLVEIDRYTGLPRPGIAARGRRYWALPVDRRLPEKTAEELVHLAARVNIEDVQIRGGANLHADSLGRLLALWRDSDKPPHLNWLDPLLPAAWTRENVELFAACGGYLLTVRVERERSGESREVVRRSRRAGLLVRGEVISDAPRQAVELLVAAQVDIGLVVSRGGPPEQAEKWARDFYRGLRRWRLWRAPAHAPLKELRRVLFAE